MKINIKTLGTIGIIGGVCPPLALASDSSNDFGYGSDPEEYTYTNHSTHLIPRTPVATVIKKYTPQELMGVREHMEPDFFLEEAIRKKLQELNILKEYDQTDKP